MTDREKVIEGQKQVISHMYIMSEVCYDGDVPYYKDLRDKAEDALALLKEHEKKNTELEEKLRQAYERGKHDGVEQYLREREEDEEWE